MLRYLLFGVAFSTLLSCSNNSQDINLQKRIQTDTSTNATAILFADPKLVDSSHLIIYPLILEQTSSGSGFSSGSYGNRTSYWNLLFYNTDSNSQHLLTNDKKIIINEFKIKGNSSSVITDDGTEEINIYRKNILYEVISKDFNQNKYLDNDDPTYLYISDRQGNNFRQLSPDNYNIVGWQVVTGTSKIILQANKDSNGDKKFNQDDAMVQLIVYTESGNVAKETFTQNYIDSLKSILSTTWKIDKK